MFKHTWKADEDRSGTIAKQLEETELNCVLNTFSARSVLNKIGCHQHRNNSECDVVALLKDTSAQEKDEDCRWVLLS